MIWFNFWHHQQKLCHFTPWSISFHVRYVSKKSVCPKGVKIEAEKRWVVKEWEFWKTEKILLYQFFNWFNFAFMVCSQFPPRNGLKLEFVLFEAERDNNAEGTSNLRRVMTFSALKRTKSIFRPLLSGNQPQTIKAKLNQLKNWYNKICSVFQNSHSLTTPPLSASIFTPLGLTNFFETYLKWKLILQGVVWYNVHWWCSKLNLIILPDTDVRPIIA